MVKTRSGKRPIIFEEPPSAKRACLRGSDVRKNGENEELCCSICLTGLYYSNEVRPTWAQCGTCKTVFHESCILRYAARSTVETFDCPNCRHTYPCNIFETNAAVQWSAEDLLDELMDQDDDYVENEKAGSPSHESEYDSDDESEEDEDIPTDRVLRSANKK